MKKKQYIQPEVNVCTVAVQSMMALSTQGGTAKPELDVLVNESNDEFTDIWGNLQ